MMYLPYKSNQREEAIKLMVDMFELVLPKKVAEEVVRKDVKLIYDPLTEELVQIVMPFESKSEVSTLTLNKGSLDTRMSVSTGFCYGPRTIR